MMYSTADSLEGQEDMKKGLGRLEDWVTTMKFNQSKCQVLHLGWRLLPDRVLLGYQPLKK